MAKPARLTTAQEAVSRIKPHSVLAFNAIGITGLPETFFPALESFFLTSGRPNDLTLLTACAISIDCMACMVHPGMISRLITGYISKQNVFTSAILENRIQAYNLPQGIISENYRAAAAHRPGTLSKVGLYTFSDPRQGGGALNAATPNDLVEITEIDGEEYLFYRAICPDVCVLRGTCADPNGNITLVSEPNVADACSIAIATHNNGGIVMVQVDSLSETPANPRDVIIPGALVDAIWVADRKEPHALVPYLTGQERVRSRDVQRFLQEPQNENVPFHRHISPADRVIARRAVLELEDCRLITLGVGLPTQIAAEALRMNGLGKDQFLSSDAGIIGGIPFPDLFGAMLNADMILDMASLFDLYEGQGLDAAFAGALEVDCKGNINVTRKGDRMFGLGGFNHLTESAPKIMICTRFQVGSDLAQSGSGWVPVDGKADKFVKRVETITMNAPYFHSLGKTVLYITERAVFRLGKNGLILTELLPGITVESICKKLPFSIDIDPDIKPFPAECCKFD